MSEIRPGKIVRTKGVNMPCGPGKVERNTGLTGIVIDVSAHGQYCGVFFPGWRYGHSLGGKLSRRAPSSGLYCNINELEVVEKSDCRV